MYSFNEQKLMTMKRFFRIFAAVALVCTTLVACEEKFDEYTPAALETTAQVYFSKDAATTINILEAETAEVTVMRAVNGAGITVPITATVDAEYADLFNIPSSVAFADGETSTTLVITFDPATLTYGEKYAISLQISADMITDYGKDVINLVLDYPEPFVSLGMAKFSDTFLFEEVYEVEVLQNSLNPTQFRLVAPYAEGLENEGFTMEAGPAEFVDFRILTPGDKIHDTEVTKEDLVYFPSYMTGFYNGTYSAEVWAHHPSTFVKYAAEDTWTHSKVVAWQDKENCLPGIVQFAPFYYMDGVGGWDNTAYDGVVTITFPGYTPSDYSLSLFSNGMQVVDGKAYPVIDAIFGENVAEMQMVVLEGHYQNMTAVWSQVPALIAAGAVKAQTVEAVDQTADDDVARMSIVGAEALEAGIYTAFVIPVNADGEAQDSKIQAVSFYMNEVAAGATEFDFTQLVLLPSQFPALAAALGLNDDSSEVMMYYEAPHYVREWKHFFYDTKTIEAFLKANPEVTLEQFVQANGDEMDLEYINDADYFSDYYSEEGLAPETSYSVIDYVVDIYGNVFCQRQDVTTAKAAATKAFRMKDVALSTDVVLRK